MENNKITRVAFAQLPKDVQEKIVRLQYFKGEHFSQKLTSPFYRYVFLGAGAAWFVTLFLWANDELWSDGYLIAYASVTAAAAVLFVYGLYLVIRSQTARLQPFVHVTPTHFIKTGYNSVEYRSLEQLRGVTSNDVLTSGGRFAHAIFDFYFDDREELVKVYGERHAKDSFQKLLEWESLNKQAVERNDAEYLNRHDIFSNVTGDAKPSGGGVSFGWVLPVLLFLIGVPALTFGVVWGASRLNRNISENRVWTEAQKTNTATAFRKYLAVYPDGQRAAEARQKIDEKYDAAARKYAERQKDAQSSAPAQAVLSLINHAKQTRQPQVAVVFERRNEMTNEAIERFKKEYDEPDLMSVGTEFSEEKMLEREKSIATAIELAFKQTIPDDVLTFVKRDAKEQNAPVLLVSYNIKPGYTAYDQLGRYSGATQRFLGFTIDWNGEVAAPNMPEPYKFALNSNPALYLNSRTYGEDLTKFSMYEMMAGSAFNDFGAQLADVFGLGTQPIKMPAPAATPNKKR